MHPAVGQFFCRVGEVQMVLVLDELGLGSGDVLLVAVPNLVVEKGDVE